MTKKFQAMRADLNAQISEKIGVVFAVDLKIQILKRRLISGPIDLRV